MLRSLARTRLMPRVSSGLGRGRVHHTHPRNFGTGIEPPANKAAWPRVPILRPLVWSVGVVTTIYMGCAAYDVHRTVRAYKQDHRQSPPDLSTADSSYRRNRGHASHHGHSSDSTVTIGGLNLLKPTALWAMLSPEAKVAASLGALSAASFATRHFTGYFFVHGALHNRVYTLFTSNFGHFTRGHLILNLVGLGLFTSNIQRQGNFDVNGGSGPGPHYLAFCLGSGTLASLGGQLLQVWPDRASRFGVSAGLSGVVMAILAFEAASAPNTKWRLLLLPGEYEASSVLAFAAAFEVLGVFGVFRLPPFNRFLGGIGHGGHLAGLAAGYAYVRWGGGGKKLWPAARRTAYNGMKKVRIV